MASLEYKMTNDVLFKLLFVKHQDLLRKLVAELLSLDPESISDFTVTNTEMPPEIIGDKFCRLDINMTVDGQRVDLEVQVEDEGDYPERSLFMWARDFSTALKSGQDYVELPRTIVLSIVAFDLFKDSTDCHSEFAVLETRRHTALTDRLSLHYFELTKRPKELSKDDMLGLWLALFGAKTEEEIKQLEEMEVPAMSEAVAAYRAVTATDEFRDLERLRTLARHNEAAALRHAAEQERAKWQSVIADKDAALADKDAAYSAALAGKDAEIADKDAEMADMAAEIARLRAQLKAND